VAKFEAGGDELAKAKGIRNIKYYPDVMATDRNQSNDVPVFRLAEIQLMKAEAILRGAAPTYNTTALSLVNELRTTRKAAPMTNLTLDDMLKERARELNWENTRRTDLIRFGQKRAPAKVSNWRSPFPVSGIKENPPDDRRDSCGSLL
jgi:hypothetical protein